MEQVRIAAVQMNGLLGQTERNLATVERFTRLAAEQRAQLVVFPELCLQGHWVSPEVYAKAEAVPDGPAVRKLVSLAEELGVFMSVGLAALHDNAVYNAQVLLGPEGLRGHELQAASLRRRAAELPRGRHDPAVRPGLL